MDVLMGTGNLVSTFASVVREGYESSVMGKRDTNSLIRSQKMDSLPPQRHLPQSLHHPRLAHPPQSRSAPGWAVEYSECTQHDQFSVQDIMNISR